jgi:hypothetical protein
VVRELLAPSGPAGLAGLMLATSNESGAGFWPRAEQTANNIRLIDLMILIMVSEYLDGGNDEKFPVTREFIDNEISRYPEIGR